MLKRLMAVAASFMTACALAGEAPTKTAEFPPLPQAVSSFGAAVSDGWLYVYGGHCTKTHEYSTDAVLGAFYRVRLSAPGKWEKLPDGERSQGLAVVAHAGKIYRIGGMQPRNGPGEKADNHSLTSCSRFDPAKNKWEPLLDLPEGRSSHDAVVIGNKLIVVGGWKLNGRGKATDWHDTTLVLDLDNPVRWESVKQPFKRRALTAAAHQGKVYVLGGMNDESKTVLTVSIFEPAKGAWSDGLDLPSPRRNGFSPGGCSVGGVLYVTPSDGRVLALGAKHDAWAEVGQLQQPRIVHRMVPAGDDRLVVLGGAAGGDNIALTEVVSLRNAR